MSRVSRFPKNAIPVTTYAEALRWAAAFSQRKINFLLLLGEAGLGKSRIFTAATGDDALVVVGRATPFELYCDLYRHKDKLVIIDDLDAVTDRKCIGLLKALCNSEQEKTLNWRSASSLLDEEDIPTTFTTRSKVAVIGNEWQTLDENVAALEDRGHVLAFDPSPQEVHDRTREWVADEEVYAFVGQWVPYLSRLSMRDYVKAIEVKHATDLGLDWRVTLLRSWFPPKLALVAELKADPTLDTEKARHEEFTRRGGGSRATYFRHAAELASPACHFNTEGQ